MVSARTLGFFALLIGVHATGCVAEEGGDASGTSESDLGGARRLTFTSNGRYLAVEVLTDEVFHVEYGAGQPPAAEKALYASPMIVTQQFAGPHELTSDTSSFQTAMMRVRVDPSTLCATVDDTARNKTATRICPDQLDQPSKALTFAKGTTEHVYGLGEEFLDYGSADGSYMGRVRSPGGEFGNAMHWWNGGSPGNAQIPILYAVGKGGDGYAFLLDNVYQQRWDFSGDPFRAQTYGDQLRGYVMIGGGLAPLRQKYMDLVGHPLVPPKRMFGYWTSEFGYSDWSEVDKKLDGLQAAGFPVDGVALDVFWFGTTFMGSAEAEGRGPMGTLRFDESHFPRPAEKLAALRNDRGVGAIVIEESYVNKELPEHQALADKGYLAKDCDGCAPTFIGFNPWWGKGGMIDWTNDAAGDFWHDQKRKPLVDMGITGFWTDLGEPEMYNGFAWYNGVEPNKHAHADIHNVYNLKWIESIKRGYDRSGTTARPFMMSRAGAAGIQRFGGAMWSGDIGANSGTLAAHLHAQMHMSMSGIDFYGADIGGFHRESPDGDPGELYTQWLGDGALFDVPARTHAWDLCKCVETTPDRIGNVASNLQAVRQRYELSAYSYSLAHLAHETGEAVFPPLAYVFPDDPAVYEMGGEKMIGSSLLAATVARHGETERDVYLPRGLWVNVQSNEVFRSNGEWLRGVPEFRAGLFAVPLFAREGAIVPKMHVDDQTMNILGKRKDGTKRDDLVAFVVPGATRTTFTLYEDDGETTAYLGGQLRKTPIAQQLSGHRATIEVGVASGMYSGAPSSRAHSLEVVLPDAHATAVAANGNAIARVETRAAWNAADTGWYQGDDNLVLVKAGRMAIDVAKTFTIDFADSPATTSVAFVCDNGGTVPGENVYIAGNTDRLGNWAPGGALKLTPSAYPKWTGVLAGLPPNTDIAWKCFVMRDGTTTPSRFMGGDNVVVHTPASGFGGTSYARF